MRRVGDYNWQQISMWNFSPTNCIEKFVTVETVLSGKQTCHFYLTIVSKIVAENHWEIETVTSLDGVPDEVLNWRNNNYRLKNLTPQANNR